MRYFLRRRIPAFDRVLLVESGSHYVFEKFLPWLYETHGASVRADLITCYPELPAGYREAQGRVYNVNDYPDGTGRKRLFRILRENRYSVAVVICSGEPIMAKWKWALGARLPVKIFVVNENGDGFWLDRGNLRAIRHFILFRLGLTGAGAVRTLAQVAAFPFTLSFLILYTLFVHLRRRVHT